MELKIISPGENGFLKEIQWNQEEVKGQPPCEAVS